MSREPVLTVRMDSVAFRSSPVMTLDSVSTVCPNERYACPGDDLFLAASRKGGDVALATREGAVHLYERGVGRGRQVVFEEQQVRRTEHGGSFEAVGDSAWRLHLPYSPRAVTFDDSGHVLGTDVASMRVGYIGSAASGARLAQFMVPGGDKIGDSVMATFMLVAPEGRSGDIIARRVMPATKVEGSDMTPLAPFFAAEPIWGLTPSGQVYFSTATDFRLEILHSTGVAMLLEVDAPRRPISVEDIDALSSQFMSMMPNNPRFREAARNDVERRRKGAPSHHPAITDVRFSPSGSVLVRGDPGDDDAIVRWDLFAADLTPQGHFQLASTDRVLLFSGDSILVARGRGVRGQRVVWLRLSIP